MNINELDKYLTRLKIPDCLYDIRAGYLTNSKFYEGFCIRKKRLFYKRIQWLVFYEERGVRQILKKFNKEEEACDYFLKLIKSDSYMWDEYFKKSN